MGSGLGPGRTGGGGYAGKSEKVREGYTGEVPYMLRRPPNCGPDAESDPNCCDRKKPWSSSRSFFNRASANF